MSLLDAFTALNIAAFSPSPFGRPIDGVPPGEVTDAEARRWAESGAEIADDAAGFLGLGRAFRTNAATPAERRGILSHVVLTGRQALRRVTEGLISGASTLAGWYREMKAGAFPRFYAGVMAMIGTTDLPPADANAVRAEATAHVGLLDRFRRQLASADQKLDGSASVRAMLYGSAAWGVAMNVWRAKMRRDGHTEERWLLGVDDTNNCSGCPYQASLGWVPIGTLPQIGSQPCRSSCRCWLSVR